MRQGQQNRRGRGRNNNNNNNNQGRKGQNPLTRSFESTGPDVKLRGTPAHIAEKYIALARDAQSSGDPVLAENNLPHAEHYNRIIMAYREQQMAQGGSEIQNGAARPRHSGFGEPVSLNDDFQDEDGEFGADQPQQPYVPHAREGAHQSRQHEGQPRYEGGRSFQNRDRDRDRHGGDRDRGYGDRDRGDRDRDRDRGDRFARGERAERPERIDRAERPDRAPQPDIAVEAPAPRRERQALPHHEQPEFLRRPVRRPRREAAAAAAEEEAAPTPTPAVENSGE